MTGAPGEGGDPAPPGEVPARFRVKRVLGAGGMGRVLLAEDRELLRTVALKILQPEALRQPEMRARFEREARAQAAVEHPHLLRIYDVQLAGDRPFLVMEVVEGEDLKAILRREGARPLAAVRRLAREVGGALDALHGAKVLHRDLKPANIMVRARDGAAVLMDLGLARDLDRTRLTETGSLVGTPRYLPPELLGGGDWSPASDQYQLGAVLYEALCGQPLVPGRKLAEIAQTLGGDPWRDPPADVGASPEVLAALRRAVDREPSRRFRDCGALAAALDAGPGDGDATAAITGGPPIGAPPGETRPGRSRWAAAAAGLGACLLVGFGLASRGGAPPEDLRIRWIDGTVVARFRARVPPERYRLRAGGRPLATEAEVRGPWTILVAHPPAGPGPLGVRLEWPGGGSPVEVLEEEPPALERDPGPGPGGDLELRLRREVRAGWEGADGPLPLRRAGVHRLEFPGRDPAVLVIEEAGARWRREVRRDELVAAARRELLGGEQRDLAGRLARLAGWLPRLLAGTREEVVSTLRALEELRRRAAAEGAGGAVEGTPPGWPRIGEPAPSGARRVPLPHDAPAESTAMNQGQVPLGSARGGASLLDVMDDARQLPEVRYRWPDAVEAAAALRVDVGRLPPGHGVEVAWGAADEPAFTFWHPEGAADGGEIFRRPWSVDLPAGLGPPEGGALRVRARNLDPARIPPNLVLLRGIELLVE